MTCAVPRCSCDAVMQGVCSAHWLEADDAVHGADRLCEEARLSRMERKQIAEAASAEWRRKRWAYGTLIGGSNYKRYLASETWAVTRALAIHDASGRCHTCHATEQLEVHHLTYVRVGQEDPDDLMVLCGRCHAQVHDKPERSRLPTRWGYGWRTRW